VTSPCLEVPPPDPQESSAAARPYSRVALSPNLSTFYWYQLAPSGQPPPNRFPMKSYGVLLMFSAPRSTLHCFKYADMAALWIGSCRCSGIIDYVFGLNDQTYIRSIILLAPEACSKELKNSIILQFSGSHLGFSGGSLLLQDYCPHLDMSNFIA